MIDLSAGGFVFMFWCAVFFFAHAAIMTWLEEKGIISSEATRNARRAERRKIRREERTRRTIPYWEAKEAKELRQAAYVLTPEELPAAVKRIEAGSDHWWRMLQLHESHPERDQQRKRIWAWRAAGEPEADPPPGIKLIPLRDRHPLTAGTR